MRELLLVIASFLIGSIPFGAIIAGIRGIDIRKVGSGNIGATNVMRSMGKAPAVLTLLGDMLKGTVVVLLALRITGNSGFSGIMGLAAILGHDFSIFQRFRGGKGVATSLGVFLAYSPITALITALLWLTTVLITRRSSLGALIAFTFLPVNMYLWDYSREKLALAILITALLILKHISNIQRLIQGTEPRIGEKGCNAEKE